LLLRKLFKMKKHLFFILFLTLTNFLFAQEELVLEAYWGAVSNFKVQPEEIKNLKSIKVMDTLNGKQISEVTKFMLMYQAAADGPVKVVETLGPELSLNMRDLINNPQPGDKIILSKIYAVVNNSEERQIPTAIVLFVD
jgi:hypothetical protein